LASKVKIEKKERENKNAKVVCKQKLTMGPWTTFLWQTKTTVDFSICYYELLMQGVSCCCCVLLIKKNIIQIKTNICVFNRVRVMRWIGS
jgi:hypothetical protein